MSTSNQKSVWAWQLESTGEYRVFECVVLSKSWTDSKVSESGGGSPRIVANTKLFETQRAARHALVRHLKSVVTERTDLLHRAQRQLDRAMDLLEQNGGAA